MESITQLSLLRQLQVLKVITANDNFWALWAIANGGLLDSYAEQPSTEDVWDKESIYLLPKPLRLQPRWMHARKID